MRIKGALGAPILENQGDGFSKALTAFFDSPALTIRAGYFGTIADVPFAIALENCGEFIAHGNMLIPTPANPKRQHEISPETSPCAGTAPTVSC